MPKLLRAKWLLMPTALILIGAGYAGWRYLAQWESTDDAQIEGHIHPVNAKVGGTVASVNVRDNQPVQAGSVLVQLDARDYEIAVARAEADVTQAQAGVTAARAGVPVATSAAGAQITSSEAIAERAKGGVELAAKELLAAQATLRSAQARAHEAHAKVALDQAQLNFEYTSVKAPVSGIVSKKTVEAGQVVQPGQPLMSIIPQEDIWVTANFKETQLADIHPGQSGTVSVDAYGGQVYKVRLDSIASATGAKFSLLPPENATGNYVKVVQRIPVKLLFEQGEDREHRLRPGMSVVAKVRVK